MNETEFSVSRFLNRNGVTSWRVTGWLHGVRIRRNFKSKDEAAAEKAALQLKALQFASGICARTTFLTDEQLREAEAAFRRITGNAHSLSFYLDYALANYREPARQQPLAAAIAEYLATKTREHQQHIISAPHLTTIRRHLKVLEKHFPGITVAELSAPALTTYFARGNAGLKTYNNRRGIVSTFLKFALQRDWIAANPTEKVAYHRIAHRRGSAPTLTAIQAQELMTAVEAYRGGCLVPYFALCLFAGIRPCLRTGEILKLRPEHVRLDTGVIHIEPEVSKVRMQRRVAIQPNLAAWLRAYPLQSFPIIIPNLQHHRERFVKSFGLSHDIMRHTFISMFVAKYRSMGEAALQAGNSETIIRKHYLDLKSTAEAEQFFAIMPTQAAAGVTPAPAKPVAAVAPALPFPPAPALLAAAS
jgi:integrase